MNQNNLVTNKIGSLFLQYCIPALLAMVITGMQGVIDGIFVGNFVGNEGMASVNIASPFLQVIIGLSMIISIGSQSHVGIKLGMHHAKQAKDCFQTFLYIIIACAALITLVAITWNKEIAMLLGADAILLEQVSTYIFYLSFFAIPMCVSFYFGFLNRIIGKPHFYLIGSTLSLVVNIVLDYFFLAHLQLGIKGAALATGIAYSVSLIVVASPMFNSKNILHIGCGTFDKKCILPVLYNGSSEGVNSFSIALTAFLFNVSLMQLVGSIGVSAFSAINYIGTLGALMLFGISDGIGPIVSYNYGSAQYNRVHKIMHLAYTTNGVISLFVFILLFCFGEQLVSIFIKDSEQVIMLAKKGSQLYSFAFLFSGINILFSGYFTFIGKGLQSVIVAASRGCLFVSFAIIILPNWLGLSGIWLSVPFAELMAFLIGLYLLKKRDKNV